MDRPPQGCAPISQDPLPFVRGLFQLIPEQRLAAILTRTAKSSERRRRLPADSVIWLDFIHSGALLGWLGVLRFSKDIPSSSNRHQRPVMAPRFALVVVSLTRMRCDIGSTTLGFWAVADTRHRAI